MEKDIEDELATIGGNEVEGITTTKNKDDAFKLLVGISATLLTTFLLLVILLWVWASASGAILGLKPAQSLITWEEEYKELTGMNEIEGLDGTGVSVCIVDSGIELSHPDLENVNFLGWYDVISSTDSPYDDDGHGTAMAGIIVADGGLEGVAKDVDLLVAKAIDNTGSGTDEGIAEAVDWCVDRDADIISLSLGGGQNLGSGIITTDTLEIAVENAIDQGVYVIAAAGNDGENDDGDVSSPGSVEEVICVGGVTRLGNLWQGSSEGDNNGQIWPPKLPRSDPDKKPEVIAPGHEVPVLLTLDATGNSWWGWSSGTSASTAWVSGGLALFLEQYPEYQRNSNSDSSKVEEIKQLISQNSQMKDGQNQHDDHFGYGIMRIDYLINSVNNSSSESLTFENYQIKSNYVSNIFEDFQTERRITANVPPDNSTKAIE